MADLTAVHAEHDLEGVAGFVDDPDQATDVVRRQVADCRECDALAADLRLLAAANMTLAVPARPRDFRLTPADAARLTATPAEPEAVTDRLGVEMTTPATHHSTHDLLLIAADLDGTLDGREATRARDQLAACTECAILRSDLVALSDATATLSTPPRPRDFSLSEADARRARGWGWRRALAAFGSRRDTVTRPLALGLTTLGLAGLLIANVPSASLFGSAASTGAAPGPQVEMFGADASAAGAPELGPLPDDAGAATTPPDITDLYAPAASGGDAGTVRGAAQAGGESEKAMAADSGVAADGPPWLVVISGILLLIGMTLAMSRWIACRLADG